jgi:prepilin-type N-terminal cleavage/methylation domain-containing protein
MDSDMRARGFTLIELLIAMGVAAMLGLFIFASYSALTVGGLRGSDEAKMQTASRVALTLLSDDIERAGFMMNGPSGQNRCARLLTYNSQINASQMINQWPVSSVVQTTSGTVQGTTSTTFGYANPGGAATDAITVAYSAGFGMGTSGMPGAVRVVKSNNGTLNNASLFVANLSSFNVGDVDIVVLPSRSLCIRMQITNLGGSNNIIHNSGKSNLNPPQGFTGVASDAAPAISPSISTTDLQQAYVQDFGQINGATGPLLVTYSIRPDPTNPALPDLWRTAVNALGTVVSDNPVVQNVVLMHALYAPLQSGGTLGAFVPWSTIVSNNQQGVVGAVQVALLVQKPNTGNRINNPAALQVLDETFTPPDNTHQYAVYTQTIYLRNVAWNAQ